MKGPDFILIGAMKCGTTTFAEQLGAQKGLFLTTPKEPNFFSDDAVFAKGFDWYQKLFAAAAPGDICGEASTHYTKRPDYPETLPRLSAQLPDIRLIYMIRNPVQRLISHYIHAWTEGEVTAPLSHELIERHPSFIDYGLYGWQIAPFVETYGREAILLTSLERMTADPQAELARAARHIGFEGPVHWDESLANQNVSAERIRKLPFHELLINNFFARTLRRNLLPKGLRTYVRDSRKMKTRPVLSAQMVSFLEARFLQDREELAAIFPEDPSLTLSYPFAKPAP